MIIEARLIEHLPEHWLRWRKADTEPPESTGVYQVLTYGGNTFSETYDVDKGWRLLKNSIRYWRPYQLPEGFNNE
jgi:hypothetical protein